ncbi:DUF501 domain-containing protein [Geochorda subterranea]|uniref:DUF501 domain-containing protein n=1 Tax=Geochorda subterranea TaxID=3109564 RepID=A0ABZ1BQ63_9FIRM|nr:DUF501 domain-containing protein [Limnochorda sp. LNt]WRP14768.1 DUF501 domain-containing protein [Limnochorda sp. LNt]
MVATGPWPPWWESPSDSDLAAVQAQLGRHPQGMVAVAARCRFGRPTVVVTAPVVDGRAGRPEPFPTTFWLTCPYLVEAVSRLESTGWIARISQAIKADPAARQALRAAHEGAARLRSSLLTREMTRRLERLSPAAVQRLAQVGVAGSRQREAVKCLHAHLADHLGRSGNPVGRRVAALLAERGVWLSGSPACASEYARLSAEGRCLQVDAPAPYNRGDLSDARS